MKYKIQKQMLVQDQGIKSTYPAIDVFKSKMTIDMHLLHEGDLYTLINKLDEQTKGIFDVDSCKINRHQYSQGSILETNTDKNLSAVCQLNWYSIKPLSRKQMISQRDVE